MRYLLWAGDSFDAASEVFLGNLDAGIELAEGIYQGSKVAVTFGSKFALPAQGAEAVEYGYMVLDWYLTAELEGTRQANIGLAVDLLVNELYGNTEYEALGGKSFVDFANENLGQSIYDASRSIIKTPEARQAVTELLTEGAIALGEETVDTLVNAIVGELEGENQQPDTVSRSCDPSMSDEVDIWLVGGPDEPPPAATIPAAFADLLEASCMTPRVQSFAGSDFESAFTRSEASGQAPEIIAGHNFLPFEGITGTVAQDPPGVPRLLSVNSAFDELVQFNGFVFIVPTADRFQVVLDLATRPRCPTSNLSSPPGGTAASSLALQATRDYLAANYVAMSGYLAPQSLLQGAEQNYIAESGDPARVHAVEVCSESGAGDIRLFSLSAGYDRDPQASHTHWSVGQANVVVLLLVTGSEWKVVLVTSDPVTSQEWAQGFPAVLAEVEPERAPGDLRVDLVSPENGAFPDAPPGERFGRFEWVAIGDHSEILAEFAEFVFEGSESRMLTAESEGAASYVSSGELWHTGGIVKWRALVLLRNGEILLSETRQFADPNG